MYINRLELSGFRNYRSLLIEPSENINIFKGRNAQGKTNLLESIYMAGTGKSFRTVRETEIINRESTFSRVQCRFISDERDFDIKVFLQPGRKRVELNGVYRRGYPLGWPGVVLFTPDDLFLVKGSPSVRRRFLDLEIGPFNQQYGNTLAAYARVVLQRNKLLKEVRSKRQKRTALEVWNEQICRYGAKLTAMRIDLLVKFRPLIRFLHRELTGGKEDLDITYISSLKAVDPDGEEKIYERFKEVLYSIESREIEYAQSMAGPHRDDLSFFINGMDAKTYGSRGQQRTLVLSLKIFQIRQWREEVNDYPVLLLDDVLFELDSERRFSLAEHIGGGVQAFITCTDEDDFNSVAKGVCRKKVYNVFDGKVTAG